MRKNGLMKDTNTVDARAPETVDLPPLAPESPPGLPALQPSPPPKRRLRQSIRLIVVLVLLAGGGLAGFKWWQNAQTQLPPGIAFGNGRTEADEIDIDTKFAGRIAEILADEGDTVKAGQVVARMDTSDLEASLNKAKAQVQLAQRTLDEANANLTQQQTEVTFAKQEFAQGPCPRAEGLCDDGDARHAPAAGERRQCGTPRRRSADRPGHPWPRGRHP